MSSAHAEKRGWAVGGVVAGGQKSMTSAWHVVFQERRGGNLYPL